MGSVSLSRRDDGVSVLTLDGAIDLAWAEQLAQHATALRVDSTVRAVLIRSDGRLFCPGGDLQWMADQPDAAKALALLAGTLHAALLELAAMEAPVVASVHGPAAGAGFSLVMAADMAIAGASATFTMAYTGVGLSPDGGSSWLLPRIVGRRRAADLMLTSRSVSADEAERIGLVTRAGADDELGSETEALLARLATGPTASFGVIKRLLDRSSQSEFADQLAAEAAAISRIAATPAGREGVAAFLEKRRPDFSGR